MEESNDGSLGQYSPSRAGGGVTISTGFNYIMVFNESTGKFRGGSIPYLKAFHIIVSQILIAMKSDIPEPSP